MAENEEKNNQTAENTEKQNSAIVTKESFCAVGGIFSLLTVIILFTRSTVFGEIGLAVHAFLLGFVGYMAYPLLFGALYLCVTGLFGWRLVKDRRVGLFVALAIVFLALALHTAFTYSWGKSGYLSACFKAGEAFPASTVCGWVGGLLVYAVSALLSKGLAIALFAVLCAFSIFLCLIFARKGKEVKSAEQNDGKPQTQSNAFSANTVTAVEIPIMQTPVQPVAPTYAQQSTYTQSAQPVAPVTVAPVAPQTTDGQAFGYGMPQVAQKPGVMLEENSANPPVAQSSSPFAYPNGGQKWTREESRAFLFGGTPKENFERNLSFGRNTNMPTAQQPFSGNTPSYSAAYENSINEQPAVKPPMKIVQDNAGGNYQNRGNVNGLETAQPYSPVTPLYPQAGNTFSTETISVQPAQPQSVAPVEPTPTPVASQSEPVQHVFDLQSKEEPLRGVDRNGDFLRGEEREEPFVRGGEGTNFSRNDENLFGGCETREVERERDGLRLFDDDNDNDDLYNLRTDFEENLDSTRSYSMEREPRGRDNTPFEYSKREESVEFDVTREVVSEARMPEREELPEPPKPTPPPKPRVIRPYVRVPLDDFDCRDVEPTANAQEVEETKATIIATLEDFKITGATIASVTFGPTVTRYNVSIPRSISPKKVVALDQSIAISLHSSGVNVYPNYDDGVVSIEVPNKVRQFVQLGCMLSGDTFVNASPSSLMFTMGKDVANRKVYGDISKMIHMLVAGASGMGKSVFLGSLIISLIYKYSPEELRLILIDPKKTEFVLYNDLPHLMINEIITDVNKAVQSLNWAIGEMNRRYEMFGQMYRAGTYVVNIDQYNEQVEKKDRLPKIVIIIDELADLMLAAKKDIEDRIQNLTQKARAAGIHLVVATQRPSTDVITGVIKSNLPTRIAFGVATDVDSRVILDQTGAQKLLGKGDFLYVMQGVKEPVRVQSAFISPADSQKVVNFIKNNNEAYFDEEATAYINNKRMESGGDATVGGQSGELDPMCIEALRHVILTGSASISMIQRKCSAGYNRAGKIIEWMEEMKYISPFEGAKARKVLITPEEFEEKYGPL